MARHFDGSTGYLEPSATIIPAGTAYTVAAWIYPDTTPANQAIFTQRYKDSSQTITFQLDLVSSNCRMLIRDSAGLVNEASSTDAPLSTTAWQSVVGTRSGDLVTVYHNGTSKDTDSTNTMGSFTSPSSGISIGAIFAGVSSASVFFDGRIAECAIWDIVLSQNDIDAYSAGVSALLIRRDKLLFYEPIVGVSPEPDFTENGITSTVNGTATKANHAPIGRHVVMPQDFSYVENKDLNACIKDYLIPV